MLKVYLKFAFGYIKKKFSVDNRSLKTQDCYVACTVYVKLTNISINCFYLHERL